MAEELRKLWKRMLSEWTEQTEILTEKLLETARKLNIPIEYNLSSHEWEQIDLHIRFGS